MIVLSEAGQDEKFAFADVANLVEKVRVYFGVNIKFRDDFGLADMVPGSLGKGSGELYPGKLAPRGFAIADIEYPGIPGVHGQEREKPGVLFVVKATMVEGLPADLYSYREAHPEFPNQTTADQFFGEDQLESYRELGYRLTKDLAEDEQFVRALSSEK